MKTYGICEDVQDVTGLNDHAPAGPNSASGHQSSVLGKRQLLGGTVEVRDTGDDQSPLFNMFVSSVSSKTLSPARIYCLPV